MAMVASFHGHQLDMPAIRKRISANIKGMNLQQLIELGDVLGLASRALQCPLDEVHKLATPCILHWDLNHFVVLTKVSGKALANIQQLPCSHLATIQNLNAAATVLIQSMPFYQLQRQGVIQLNFAATSEALKLRLHQRLGLSENAKGPDLLLNYHRVELSAAFFAPSISFLEQSAKD